MTDTPKIWSEMTDAEKGALLLAHHEGKVIEYSMFGGDDWGPIKEPSFGNSHSYRIRPEPKRETVTLYSDVPTWRFEDCGVERPEYAITFETIDGKPDCDTIRMEELL